MAGNVAAVVEEDEEENDLYDDSALDESIRFFRTQQRYEFDSDESDINCSYSQSQLDRALGIPFGWTSKDPDVFIYIDDANGVEKVRVPGSVVNISTNKQVAYVCPC